MSDPRVREGGFRGVAQDTAPFAIPPGLYQEDQGGDRFFRGVWRPRKGLERTNLAKYDGAVTSILGFEIPGDEYAILVVEGENVQGALNVAAQSSEVEVGFGESEFGEEDFGE